MKSVSTRSSILAPTLGDPSRPRALVALAVVVVAVVVLAAGAVPLRAQEVAPLQDDDPDGPGDPPELVVCIGKADGTPCPNFTDPNPNDCRAPICDHQVCDTDHPVETAKSCADTDGNVCTVARCTPGTGTCDQTAANAPNGTACSTGDPVFCGEQTCQSGVCTITGSVEPAPPMNDPASVAVEMSPARVTESESFIDCCAFCEEQWLEALVPAPGGPKRREADGGLPLRATFCGEVADYGINDELDDPRDIMINITAADGFDDFLDGFLNTECTPFTDDEKAKFDIDKNSDGDCPLKECHEAIVAADADPSRPGRCIHAELTPADQFFDEDRRFLPITDGSGPCEDGWSCASELEGEAMCVHGVYALDHGKTHRPSEHQVTCCSVDPSHDRPEVHPFDAAWWIHPDREGWMFGVFQDDSNRYSSPYCGSQGNHNRWSQAPRDATFEFPFSFPRAEAPKKLCLRHLRTTDLGGRAKTILPLNVTTAGLGSKFSEAKSLMDGKTVLATVVEPAGFEGETQVRLDGCPTADTVQGVLTVRVAVGCGPGMACSNLSSWDPNGRHDTGDAGSGLYLAELTLESGACP